MAKEAYYFSHDSNARNDEKILSLRMDLGMEGYGIFWSIIEMLRDSNNYKMRTHYERIAFELHVNSETVKKVINDYELFTINDNFFYSESLLSRMKKKEEKSKKARDSALNRWNNAKSMRTHSKRNASKGNKSKEKEIDKEREFTILQKFKEHVFKEAKELHIEDSITIKFLEHWTERDFDSGLFAWQVPESFIIRSRLKGWLNGTKKETKSNFVPPT